MSTLQPIHVRRYHAPENIGYLGTVEPDDRSWVVFIRNDGEATLWRRVEVRSLDGKADHAYLDVELPCATVEGHPLHPKALEPPPKAWPGPIDYTVSQQTEDADGVPKGTFTAWLNARQIGCTGATEHEAIRNLMNYVAQLCVAGSMDHTGRPVPATNRRRYKAVWPDADLSAPSVDPAPPPVEPDPDAPTAKHPEP